MVRVGSLFGQLLNLIPRNEFARLVRRHQAEKAAKGFTCWTQLVSMLFLHMAAARSLREIHAGLSSCLGKLVHLGLRQAPPKSTLAYANAHRPFPLFRDAFYLVLDQVRVFARPHKFRFKNKLLSLDATVISLCLSLFPWATFRRKKGALKVHVLIDHDGHLPVFAHVTPGSRYETTVARTLVLPRGSIVAMDMAYCDFAWFHRLTEQGVFFVTRMKDNAAYAVVKCQPRPQHRNILADQLVRMTGPLTQKKYPDLLRRVVVWDPEHEREIVLLTNHLDFGATTIAAIYKDRWQIELFFKVLKQHLRVKTFVGTTENALQIQIWTALIALLLMKYAQFRSTFGWSLSNLVAVLRWNLFTYRDLIAWLNDPYQTPPLEPPEQLILPLPRLGQHPVAARGT